MVTRSYKGLQALTRGYRGSGGYQVVLGVTRGNRGLQWVTGGYKRLQGVKRGYRGLQGITGGYKGLQGVTKS